MMSYIIDIDKYYGPAGYGSLNSTLADAKAIGPTIKLDDVNKFFNNIRWAEEAIARD